MNLFEWLHRNAGDALFLFGVFSVLIIIVLEILSPSPSGIERCARSCGDGRLLRYTAGVVGKAADKCECRETP